MGNRSVVTGNIITMDPGRPRAEAMAIIDGRIAHVGSLADAQAAAGAQAEQHRFDGGAIIPGLIDTHNHMLWTGIQQQAVDLPACKSIAEVIDAVRRFAAANPQRQWITSGLGWHIEKFAEKRYPTRQELDQACADRPVYLNRGGHVAACNSLALQLAGIDRHTPEPEGGRIVRDAAGEPSGVLLEAPAFMLVERHMPPRSRADQLAALRSIQAAYHRQGLCGVVDPGLPSDEMGVYQELWQQGGLTMRATVMPLAQTDDDPDRIVDRLAAWGFRTGFGDSRMRIGGIKIYMDGGGSLGTALMREPYPDERCNCGIQVTHTSTFHRLAEFCARNRWSLGVHTVGGKAIDIALAVFDDVNQRYPIRDLRFNIIHAYLWPSAENIATAARLGVGVATQPTMQYSFAPMLVKRFGAEAFGRATPIRSWLDGGVMVGGGSDSPINAFSPLLGLWHAITRYVDDLDTAIGPQEAVSPEAALAMYTRNAAWFTFNDHECGMLKPGYLGDWVALSVDPLACDPQRIRDASVLATAVGGTLVHQQ
ncbi:MAG: amidohydrolase [Burkholderiales bacterium]|nr:amidohydrolase [Burkholderiales bacterium]